MPKDLHSYLSFLEENYPDHVKHVTKEVDPIFEVTAIIAKLEKQKRFPVVIFHNVKGSNIPLVINIHSDFKRLAMAIGLPENANIKEFTELYDQRENNPIEPVIVDSKDAPVQQVIWEGDDVDLFKLPTLKYHEKDAGRYFTAGYEIMIDPDTGVRNAGIYRLMVHNKNEVGIQISETAHGHYIMKKYRKRNETMQFAVSIGHHPAFNLGCLSFTPYDVDEFCMAGAMMEEPVRLVKCKTIDMEVPADAEIILECEMKPDEFRDEAPFGEYP